MSIGKKDQIIMLHLTCMSGKNICILNNEDMPGENQTIREEV